MALITTHGNVRRRGHAAARSRSCWPATRRRSPGCGPVAEIAGLIDAGELRLDISERGLLSDTSVFHERADAGRPGDGGWPRTAAGPPNTHGATSPRHKSLNTNDHVCT
jgi:hypothetical protein